MLMSGAWLRFLCRRELHFLSRFPPALTARGPMKSRLLSPPVTEERELDEEKSPLSRVPAHDRREADQPEQAEPLADTDPAIPEPTPSAVPSPASAQTSAQVSARPTGRYLVAAMLLVCLVTVGYSVWSTFLRDAAYGVVTGQVTEISPPWAGILTSIHVRPGDKVRQGDVLAVVEDPDLQASIDRLCDDLRGAQAHLDAQAAVLAVAARQHASQIDLRRADYYELRGELLAEQSRLEEVKSKLTRRRASRVAHAFSDEEVESLELLKQGLTAKTENLSQAVAAMESQLETTTSSDNDIDQLKPWLAKIETTQAEIRRLREKQYRGILRATDQGKLLAVNCQLGERAVPEQAIFEMLPTDALELVLYIRQGDTNDYHVGELATVMVDPLAEPLECRITRVGPRMEKPQTHVVGRYRPEEKLLPIYLAPTSELSAAVELRPGSTVRLPFKLFGASH